MRLRNILSVVSLSAVVCTSAAYAGKVELTTYYPAPYGEYSSLSATSSLVPPRMTTAQRDAISETSNPPLVRGMVIFNTDTNQLEVNRSADPGVAEWGAAGGSSGSLQYTKWGDTTCATGYNTLYTGHMFQAGQNNADGGEIVCATGGQRSANILAGASNISSVEAARPCAVCAKPNAKFCYTKWGDTDCASGFTAVYSGYMYANGPEAYGNSDSSMLCSTGDRVWFTVYPVRPSVVPSYEQGGPCAQCCSND